MSYSKPVSAGKLKVGDKYRNHGYVWETTAVTAGGVVGQQKSLGGSTLYSQSIALSDEVYVEESHGKVAVESLGIFDRFENASRIHTVTKKEKAAVISILEGVEVFPEWLTVNGTLVSPLPAKTLADFKPGDVVKDRLGTVYTIQPHAGDSAWVTVQTNTRLGRDQRVSPNIKVIPVSDTKEALPNVTVNPGPPKGTLLSEMGTHPVKGTKLYQMDGMDQDEYIVTYVGGKVALFHPKTSTTYEHETFSPSRYSTVSHKSTPKAKAQEYVSDGTKVWVMSGEYNTGRGFPLGATMAQAFSEKLPEGVYPVEITAIHARAK